MRNRGQREGRGHMIKYRWQNMEGREITENTVQRTENKGREGTANTIQTVTEIGGQRKDRKYSLEGGQRTEGRERTENTVQKEDRE